MSKMLENLRSLRDEVVLRTVSEASSCEAPQEKVPQRKRQKKRSRKEAFKLWKSSVGMEVEEQCGMDIDVLDGAPWVDMYKEGVSPKDAASLALQWADEEDIDDEDDLIIGSYGESLSEGSSLRRRSIVSEVVHDDYGVEFSDQLSELEELEAALEDDFGDNYQDQMKDVIESIGTSEVSPVSPRRVSPKRVFPSMGGGSEYDRIAAMVEETAHNPPEDEGRAFDGIPGGGAKMPAKDEFAALSGVSESMRQIAEQERLGNEEFVRTQKREQEEDKRRREDLIRAREKEDAGEEEVVEASVQGGDFGRWRPATSAAGAGGRSIASAVSKASGVRYKFHPEGTAQSSDVGSDLWFEIEPADPKEPIYYLGVKIKGDKENPTWDAMLKRGKGLGSSSMVSSQRGMKTSELASGVKKLASGIGKSKE